MLYPFVPNPGQVNPLLFGFVDLAKPNYVLAVIAGAISSGEDASIIVLRSDQTASAAEVGSKTGAKDETWPP